ncbi:MAG TPA: hypothetical protein VFU21_26110 [Kofleriaceae bacterium]|nr:hypothetical protein [Kofleriaceae bacterium]
MEAIPFHRKLALVVATAAVTLAAGITAAALSGYLHGSASTPALAAPVAAAPGPEPILAMVEPDDHDDDESGEPDDDDESDSDD